MAAVVWEPHQSPSQLLPCLVERVLSQRSPQPRPIDDDNPGVATGNFPLSVFFCFCSLVCGFMITFPKQWLYVQSGMSLFSEQGA